eukprot:gene10631-3254_t
MKVVHFFIIFSICIAFVFAQENKPEDPAPGVIDVTPSNVNEVISTSKHALVEFYAPWCGHCKNLVPEYHKLGEAMLARKPADLSVAKVNCVAHAEICSKYGVQGYPTIKFFKKGDSNPQDYNGGRSAEDFVDYLNKNAGSNLRIQKAPTHVVDLTPGNFDKIAMDKTKDVLVEFYAPWCGHCKQLAPKYEILAKAYEAEENIVIAKVDADKHRSLGERFGVKGFPTLKWFGKANKDAPSDFNRGTEDEMLQSVNSKTGAQRDISGKLGANAGIVEALSTLTKKFKGADEATKKDLIKQAQDYVASSTEKVNGGWYVKIMQRALAGGDSYIEKESHQHNF